MKFISPRIALVLTLSLSSLVSFAQQPESTLKGPYLGQTPPGSTPKTFAPGIVSTQGWEVGPDFHVICVNSISCENPSTVNTLSR